MLCLLTSMRRTFFSDRSRERERTRNSEDKGIAKFGTGDLAEAVSCQASLLRSPTSYTLFPVGKWDRLGRKCHIVEPSQREVNQTMLHRGNTKYLKNVTD